MRNRDIYVKDPSTWKLVNEGVASVNDEQTDPALAVLRYELETFVCDGQYKKGLEPHFPENYHEVGSLISRVSLIVRWGLVISVIR